MKVYHGSPYNNIQTLKVNTYVTLFPHVAYVMGLYYKNDNNRTWNDNDLVTPYNFGDKIYFKIDKKPDGYPTLYVGEINANDIIIINNNFPYEFKIKKKIKMTKLSKIKTTELIKILNKMHKLMDIINFN